MNVESLDLCSLRRGQAPHSRQAAGASWTATSKARESHGNVDVGVSLEECWDLFCFLSKKSRVCTTISHCRKKLFNKTWKDLGSERHVCPVSFLTAYVVPSPPLAVIACKFGHLRMAPASSRHTFTINIPTKNYMRSFAPGMVLDDLNVIETTTGEECFDGLCWALSWEQDPFWFVPSA